MLVDGDAQDLRPVDGVSRGRPWGVARDGREEKRLGRSVRGLTPPRSVVFVAKTGERALVAHSHGSARARHRT